MMKINITDDVAKWYKEELALDDGDSVKFFGKVYGVNGFSIALAVMEPSRPLAQVEKYGVTFFVEKSDSWFFEGVDLNITLNEEMNEPHYDMGK